MAKLDGDLSEEQKSVILNQFESKFSLDSKGASELLGSAAHLLGSPQIIDAQLNGVGEKNKDNFSKEQAESMLEIMVEVATAEDEASAKQRDFIALIRTLFVAANSNQGTWS